MSDSFLGPYRSAGEKPKRIAEQIRRIVQDSTPAQVAFILDQHRSLALKAPRRVGKTSAFLRKFCKGGLQTRNGRYLYTALSRPHAEELLWIPLKDFAAQYELRADFAESDLTMTLLDTGSTLSLLGADDKKECDKKRGGKYHGVGVDEAASFPTRLLHYFLDQVLSPALMDYRGWLALGGTPSSTLAGAFYEATREGAERTRPWRLKDAEEFAEMLCACPSICTAFEWSLHDWTLEDAALSHIIEEAYAKKAQKGWTDENPIWQREYMGRWVADDTGRVYRYRKHAIGEDGKALLSAEGKAILWNSWEALEKTTTNPFGLPLGHDWRFCLGGDLGSKRPADEQKKREQGQAKGLDVQERNKTILELWAYADTSPNLYHALESAKAMHISALAAEIQRIEKLCGAYKGVTLDGIFIDVGYRSGGGMIVDELSAVHGVPAMPADKARKPDAIELLNSDLVDGRAKILPGSHLETEMLTLQWDELQPDKENKSQANDACDAGIYGRRGCLHQYGHELPARTEKPEDDAPRARAAAEPSDEAKPAKKRRAEWFGSDEDENPPDDEWGNDEFLTE